jgi:histidine triad (HIT) family protein
MSLDGVYDPNNIFVRLMRGELPCAKVFEDDDTFAFMDAYPQGPGHALVVHKRSRARNLLEAEPGELNTLIASVKRLAMAMRRALNPDGVTVMQFNGAASGQTIFHLHFHVIPRWDGVPLGRHGAGSAEAAELTAMAARIAAKIDD